MLKLSVLLLMLIPASLFGCSSDADAGDSSSSGSSTTPAGTADTATDDTTTGADADGGESTADDTATDGQTTAGDTTGGRSAGDTTTGDDSGTEDTGTTDGGATGGGDAGPTAEVLELGSFALNGGSTEVIKIDVDSETTSLSISAVGAGGITYAVEGLTAPDGTTLAAAGWPTSPSNQGGTTICLNCPNRITSGQGAHGVLVPNTPAVAFSPGQYRFFVSGFNVVQGGAFTPPTVTTATGEVEVIVSLQKRPADLPDVGVLNLNLFFTGAHALTAATAPDDSRIQEALTTFADTYEQVGVALGAIRYFDLGDPAYIAIESINGPGNDFEAASALTVDAPPGVNLIFVRDISDASNPLGGVGTILGVAGGIPGPTSIQGTGRSAVFVSLDSPPTQPGTSLPELGHTMAHEIGHYLGLYHASEIFNAAHDPIPDSPQGDPNNLMYYSAEGNTLSPGQGTVIRNNPWVAPINPEDTP